MMQDAADIGGFLDGFDGTCASCNNQTTSQTVSFALEGGRMPSCTLAGREVLPGDLPRVVMRGVVQQGKKGGVVGTREEHGCHDGAPTRSPARRGARSPRSA